MSIPSFPINTAIPNAPNDPADDQPKMQVNFLNIDGYLSVDHIDPRDVNNGTHKQVTLTNKSPPGLATGTNGVLFSNTTTDGSGDGWPWWQNAFGAFSIMGGRPSQTNPGYIWLAGGILLQYGFINSTASSYQTFAFASTGISFPNNCFNVWTQPYTNGSVPGSQATVAIDNTITPPDKNSFKWVFVTSSADYKGFYWFAIGN